jgi:hypothetical protein
MALPSGANGVGFPAEGGEELRLTEDGEFLQKKMHFLRVSLLNENPSPSCEFRAVTST